MKKIKLDIIGLSYSQTQSGAYALVLGEEKGKRRLPIIIGGFEAQAIAIELEQMTPSRPLTHDLFKSFAVSFGIEVQEVIIYNLVEGIFFAKLVCGSGDKVLEIDARTSDAIAISVRFNCPIYTYEFILSTAGIILEEGASMTEVTTPDQGSSSDDKKKGMKENELTQKNIEDLNTLLQSAIEEEDYEKASKIRDEIKKRKQS
jgi:bifunctional DNase/RNase